MIMMMMIMIIIMIIIIIIIIIITNYVYGGKEKGASFFSRHADEL